MGVNRFESPQQTVYDSSQPDDPTRRPSWTVAQLVDGWLATGFTAAIVIPTVILLQRMTVGTTLSVWWSATLPSIGLVAIVTYLAARCLRQRPIRYRLRTLMVVLALGPPVLASVWLKVESSWPPILVISCLLFALCAGMPLFVIATVIARRLRQRQ